MYDVALWKYYSVTAFSKSKAAYNKCIEKLFGYAGRDSMSGILLDLGLQTADTIVHNSRVLFANYCLLWFADCGLLTLLCGKFIFMGLFCSFMYLSMFLASINYGQK